MAILSYAGLGDLLDRVARDAIAERAAPNDHDVTGGLLRAWALDGLRGSALAPDANDPAAVEAAVAAAAHRVGLALADASARVEGHLAARYPDLTPPSLDLSAAGAGVVRSGSPALLAGLCVDLFLGQFFGGEEYTERAARATRFLTAVAEGRMDLPADADGDDAQAGAEIARSADPETFSRSALGDYLSGV